MRSILLTILVILATCAASSAQVAVIAHKNVPMTKIDRSALLDFYTFDKKEWSSGEPVVIKDLKPKTEVKSTFYDYLGKSTSRMKSIWLKMMLSGEGDPPETLQSEDEMVKKVASTPGALGFVGADKVNNDVKILLTIPVEKKE
jgi:ABC-type phosphate transport system substrate-binding protein